MSQTKSKYLTSAGQRLVKALFHEYSYQAESEPLYTFQREDKEVDGKVYPSLYRLYMACDDISEASFVSQYMYDLKQWDMIRNNNLFKDEINEWRRNLRMRKLGQVIEVLEKDALDEGPTSTASAKFLADKVYGLPKRSGRPVNKQGVSSDDNAIDVSSGDEEYKRLFENVTPITKSK